MLKLANAISVENVTKVYDGREAVSDLSFSVASGTITALLGPNGAGKTTTVEMLEGYHRPDRGRVEVLGCDPVADAKEIKPRMGLMLQTGGIYPGAHPDEILNLFSRLYPNSRDPKELLQLVGLQDETHKTYRRLSGGQQRRLALAVALIGRPDVVFLDEPTAGMDPKARQLTYRVVHDLRDRGATVLLTTHLIDEAEDLADQVVIIDRGRLVARGSPTELMASSHGIRFGAQSNLDLSTTPRELGNVEQTRAGHYLAHCEPTPVTLACLATWASTRGILLRYTQSGSRSLEDVFLESVE